MFISMTWMDDWISDKSNNDDEMQVLQDLISIPRRPLMVALPMRCAMLEILATSRLAKTVRNTQNNTKQQPIPRKTRLIDSKHPIDFPAVCKLSSVE